MNNNQNKISSDRKGVGCLTLFFFPFVLLGLGTFLFSSYYFFKSIQASTWQKAEAQIIYTNLDKKKAHRIDDVDTYENKAEYLYAIDGQEYKGNKIGFGYSQNNFDRHFQVSEKLKYAHKITVWVNPRNHSESVISKGINNSTIGVFLFSLMWNSLVGSFIVPIICAYRDRKNVNLIFTPKGKTDYIKKQKALKWK